MQPVTNIVQLRQLLAERFPNVRMRLETTEKSHSFWPTGIGHVDALLEGGLPKGALTELVSPDPSAGSALVVEKLLRTAATQRQWAALVDGHDSFDPSRFDNAALRRVLWVRCPGASQALKAADFLLRDGNVALVIIDLRVNPVKQLQKVPSSTWYRLQRCVEPTAAALLVVTPRAMVGAAQTRLRLAGRLTLDALGQNAERLLQQLPFDLVRRHGLEPEHRELLAHAG